MADKTIGELPAVSEVYDDSLLVMEQQGEARSVPGALIRKYAIAAAKEQAEAAARSARDAADVALHPPILKEENDHWWIWDTGLNDYKDSGVDAGVSLDVIEEIITGEPGTPASVENKGTKTDPVLQFTIPQGQKGDTGDAATIEVGEVTTGEPGTSASVKNSGTPGAAKLDFVIPQGPAGRGFTILGYYETADELQTAVQDPVAGDAYGVGTEKPYDIYIYDDEKGWVNNGPIGGVPDLPPHLVVAEDSDIEGTLSVDADTLEGHPAEYFAGKETTEKALQRKTGENILHNARWDKLEYIVNQRRVSGTIETAGYFIDRWNLISGTVQLTDGGLVLDGTMVQILENDPGEGLVASVLTSTGLGTATYTAANKTFTITATGQTILAAKLEVGDEQTLAHQSGAGWVLNDPAPDYGVEMAKCERYMKVLRPSIKNNDDFFGIGFNDARTQWVSDTKCFIMVSIGVPLRARPTCKTTGAFAIFAASVSPGRVDLKEGAITFYSHNSNFVTLSCQLSEQIGEKFFEAGTPLVLIGLKNEGDEESAIILDANL